MRVSVSLSIAAVMVLGFACGTEESARGLLRDDAGVPGPEPRDGNAGTTDTGRSVPLPTEGAGTRFFPRYRQLEFSDGSIERKFIGFFDRERSEDCSIEDVATNEFRCVPPSSFDQWRSDRYKDAACTKPIFEFKRRGATFGVWQVRAHSV
jgi:hypothetical protein